MVARNPPSGSSPKRPQAQKLGASLDPKSREMFCDDRL
jgi:hypothetical protein